MALKAIYDSKDDIPEKYQDLYTEKGGKWELTGIEGIKTTADTERLSASLTKERDEHKKTKEKLTAFGDLDPAKAIEDADKITELETRLETAEKAAGDNKPDEEQINKLVEARVATVMKPLERELEKANKTLGEQTDALTAHALKDTNRTIGDAVRSAAGESKIIPSAMEDALMLGERVFEVTDDGTVLTRDAVGVTPGITPDIWFTEMQDKRGHWWPDSRGGGAGGGGGGAGFSGSNPFTNKDWNMTKQGEVTRLDPEKAARMASSAGTTVGGPKPAAAAA